MSKIKSTISVIFHAINGVVYIRLTHLLVMILRMYTLLSFISILWLFNKKNIKWAVWAIFHCLILCLTMACAVCLSIFFCLIMKRWCSIYCIIGQYIGHVDSASPCILREWGRMNITVSVSSSDEECNCPCHPHITCWPTICQLPT